MKPLILAILALLCLGCQARQTNIALQQSDQAQEAAQKIVIERIAPRLPADVQESVKESMDQVIALLSASRASIRSAIMLTAGGEPLPNPGTMVQDAMDRHQQFISEVSIQAGRAEAEVEQIGWYASIGTMLVKFGQEGGGNLLTMLLGGAGGGGLLLAGALKYVGRFKTAVRDAVAFGNEAIETNPQDVVQRNILIERHKEIQKTNGTQAIIRSAGAAVKSRS